MSTNATDIAEINVIGSILLNPGSFQLIDLRTEDFYFALHQNIFQTISDLSRNGEIIDPVTVQAKLEAKGQKIPAEILRSFASVTVTAANVEEYARIVKNASLIRSLKSMSSEMQDVHDTDDGQEILVRSIKKLDELMQNGTPVDVIDSVSALLDLHEYRNAISEKPDGEFIRTGFENLDRILGGGLLKGGYYILAARTSMGKTSVALQMADNVAGYHGNVLFVSLEMSVRQMTAKRISRLTGIPNMKILTGSLSADEYRKFGDAASTLAEIPVILNKRVSASVADVQTMAVRVNPCLIIIDYLGLIRPGSRRKSKYEEITEISHDLKALALKLNIP
ncbi:replicative DNA helicase, partial [Sporobacter termitidis DSM 10068]